MKYRALKLFGFLAILIFSAGCITSNYYTARTLKQGKTVLNPGVDNLILITKEEGIVTRHLSFMPSLGFARGLPWRFETGLRAYFPFVLEANLRHQLNPGSFDWFDISANLHVGAALSEKLNNISTLYYKYGITISKKVFTVEPYYGYYFAMAHPTESGLNGTSTSTVCFGLAIPYKSDLIFPEFNYYKNNDEDKGYFAFGIGLRTPLRKPKSNK